MEPCSSDKNWKFLVKPAKLRNPTNIDKLITAAIKETSIHVDKLT